MTVQLSPRPGAESAPRSTGELRERILESNARREPLRVLGAGRWLDAGRPVHATAVLSTRTLEGIIEYVPGDLTLTAGAGTALRDIQRATAAHGQWLTLDPHGEDGTLGATVATGSYGPLAHQFGTPRDLVLGMEFVTGAGDIVRSGGRVVKNVAGFDLTRLLTGSWGTLGVLTEITVRLRALPEVQITLAIPIGDSAAAVDAMRGALRVSNLAPLSAQLLDARAAARLAVGRGTTLLLRIGGNTEAVASTRDRARVLGNASEADMNLWDALRTIEPAGAEATVLRLSQLPSRFAATWSAALRVVERCPGALCHGDPGRGVARCVLPHDSAADPVALGAALDFPFAGTRIFERLPETLWAALAPSGLGDRLSRSIKHAYDPANILNPGILGS